MDMVTLLLAATIALPPFGDVKVVDEVDCTKTDHRFADWPKGSSRVETILGKPCRVLDVQSETASYLDWRLGEGKGLKPNAAYVVVIEYPDDKPRAFHVRNYGNNSRRSFYTGRSNGDAFEGPIVHHKPESLNIPQSGKYERWTSLTFLGEKAANRRDLGKDMAAKTGEKPQLDIATDGFEVAISQYKRHWHPCSEGIAVSRIQLCEILDEKAAWAKLNLPPAPLPRRHIFWREEMADGVMAKDSLCPGNGGVDWIEQKFRAMKIFGQNTYCKDLLEFGHNQHWDCNWKHGKPGGKSWKWMWACDAYYADLWTKVVALAVEKYGFDLLPYYEYGGAAPPEARRTARHRQQARPQGAGRELHAHLVVRGQASCRHHRSRHSRRAQVHPRRHDTPLQGSGRQGGFRGRTDASASWALGDQLLRQDARALCEGGERRQGRVARGHQEGQGAYIAWYGKKRAQFMDEIRKYLEENGVKNAISILENDDSETGYPLADGGSMTTDDLAYWKEKLPGKKIVDVNDPSVVGQHRYLKALKTPAGTWNVWIALPFHALFTVTDPECLSAFANGNGTATLIRHYDLNEGTFDSEPLLDPNGNPVKNGKGEVEKRPITGYAMADWEHAGRACMIAEVNAMANGDPVNLGYLMGSNYTRGFPVPVREFNLNFLALPALPSKVVKGACSDPEVVLREIDCSKLGVKAKYYALVHTGWKEKNDVKVKIPGAKGEVEFAAYGKSRALKNGVLEFKTLKPFQLLAIKSK